MRVVDCSSSVGGGNGQFPSHHSAAASKGPLHRLAAVRRRQNISRRTVARRMRINVSQVKMQEKETADLTLSTLYAWQQVLGVPLGELLVEAEDGLSTPIKERAQLVRLMKTAKAILHHASQTAIRRMAQVLVEQLTEIMPELKEVGPWHSVGQLRSREEYGRVVERRFPDYVFSDHRS